MSSAWLYGECGDLASLSGRSGGKGSLPSRPEPTSPFPPRESGESDGTGSFPPTCAVAPHPDELEDGLMGECWPL